MCQISFVAFTVFISAFFTSSIATSDSPLWMRCAADDENGGRVHLGFSNMVVGNVSMSGRSFIESMVAWDGSSDLDATAYDKISINSGSHFGCESRFDNTILHSIRCAHTNNSNLGIRANYAKGVNPSSTVISKIYSRLTFDLEHQQGRDDYVVKVNIGSESSERDNFIFTQTLTNLECLSSNDN